MTRVLLVEDHELMRRGTLHVLAGVLPGAAFDEASTTAEANQHLAGHPVDLLVLDLNLPGRSGLELLEEIRGRFPGLKVLVLSAYREEELAVRCIRLGAAGYLAKGSAAAELEVAVHRILGGGRYLSPALAERLALEVSGERERAPHEALSPRELQVLRLLALGRAPKQIGEALHLSDKTVATYRARVSEKLGLPGIADLTRYAIQHGLID